MLEVTSLGDNMSQGHTRRRLAPLAAMTAFIMTMFVVAAPIASAHHPEISASSYCDESGAPVISFRAYSWLQDPSQDGKSGNPDIGIYVRTSGSDWEKVTSGAFTEANGYEFDGVFDATKWAGMTVTVKARADQPFNNGNSQGEYRKVDVHVPADCSPPDPTEVSVSVSGVCSRDGDEVTFSYAVSASAGVTVDFDDEDLNLTDGGTYESVNASADWTATAPDGAVFEENQEPTLAGSTDVEDCTPRPRSGTRLGAIGDFVWFDLDRDGVQGGPGDTPVTGATVELLVDGAVVASQVTGSDGKYLFDDLSAGEYQVRFTVPGFAGFTDIDDGWDDVDSDAAEVATNPLVGITGIIDLAVGEVDLTVDAGVVVEVEAVVITTTTTAPPTTTIPPVSVSTLPFTGSDSTPIGLLALNLLAGGALILLASYDRPTRRARPNTPSWQRH